MKPLSGRKLATRRSDVHGLSFPSGFSSCRQNHSNNAAAKHPIVALEVAVGHDLENQKCYFLCRIGNLKACPYSSLLAVIYRVEVQKSNDQVIK